MRKFYFTVLIVGICNSLSSQTVLPSAGNLVPQYAVASASSASQMMTVCRLTLTGLTPGATYRYVTAVSSNASQPLGTIPTGGMFMINDQATASVDVVGYTLVKTFNNAVISPGEWNTNATGKYGQFTATGTTYTGWFATVADGTYAPGTSVYFYVYVNNGAGGATANKHFRTTQTITLRDFSTGTNGGVAVSGSSFSEDKKMVVLWDNISPAANTQPLFVTWTEQDNITTTWTTWYTTYVDGKPGKWGGWIPNNNGNGLRRIDFYNGSGSVQYKLLDGNNDGALTNYSSYNQTAWQNSGTTPIQIDGQNFESLIVDQTTDMQRDCGTLSVWPNGTITLNANLNVNANTLSLSSAYTGSGNANFSASSNLSLIGTAAFQIPTSITSVNNLTIACSNLPGATLNGDLTVNGTLLFTSNGILSLNGKKLTTKGSVQIAATSGSSRINSDPNGVLEIAGTSTNVIIPPFTSSPISNMIITNPNGVKMTDDIRTTTLTFNGGFLDDNGKNMLVSGDIIGAGTHISTAALPGKISLATGSSKHKVGSAGGVLSLNILELNDLQGSIMMGDVTINQELSLGQGLFEVNNSVLTLKGLPIGTHGNPYNLITTFGSTIVVTGTASGHKLFPVLAAGAPYKIGKLVLDNPNGLELDYHGQVGTELALKNGFMDVTDKVLNVFGDITGTPLEIGAAVGVGKVVLNGTSLQKIGSVTLTNVEVNNTSNILMNGNIAVVGLMNLIAGKLQVDTKALYILGSLATPIVRTTGQIEVTKNSTFGFGSKNNFGYFNAKNTGATLTLPTGVFRLNSTSPTRATGAIELGSFIMNRTNPITLDAAQQFDIHRLLSIVQGEMILPAGYQLDMKSNSISETAMFDVISNPATAKITYGTNSLFCIERFIPKDIDGGAGRRAYRDIAPGVVNTIGSMWSNWQDGAPTVPIPGVGIHISGKKGPSGVNDPSTGLDMTTSGETSAYTYWTGSSGVPAWLPITNTKTVEFNGLLPYHILVRGDRTYADWWNMQYMGSTVKFRSKGKLIVGDVVINKTGATASGMGFSTNTMRMNSGNSTGSTMLANPYAAPISWTTFSSHNPTITDTYTIYDPNVNTLGGFVSYKTGIGCNMAVSAMTDIIQPGQAFYVRNLNTNNSSVTFKETDKYINPTALTTVFKTSSPSQNAKQSGKAEKIRIGLMRPVDGIVKTVDAALVGIANQYSNNVDYNDVPKSANPENNISILKAGKEFSIETKSSLQPNDTLALQISKLTPDSAYSLTLDLKEIALGNDVTVAIKDNLTNQLISADKNNITTVSFVPGNDPNAYKNRFDILFRTAVVLPVNFIRFTGYVLNKGAQLEWVTAEKNMTSYLVERSSDAEHFNVIGSVDAKNATDQNNYSFYDEGLSETNYYRIAGVDLAGKKTYTSIVRLMLSDKNIELKAYPNPAVSILNIKAKTNAPEGVLSMQIVNASGQTVITHNTPIISNTCNAQIRIAHLPQGKYLIRGVGEKDNFSVSFEIVR